jgi:6-phosphogluconolactonase/glucosamine-6-phosphate isomerase/deaminase
MLRLTLTVPDNVKRAITMGVSILQSKRIVLMAWGQNKSSYNQKNN